MSVLILQQTDWAGSVCVCSSADCWTAELTLLMVLNVQILFFLISFFPSVNSSRSTTHGLLHHWPPLSPPPLLLPSPRIAPFVIPITLCHYIHILIVPLSSFLLLSPPFFSFIHARLFPSCSSSDLQLRGSIALSHDARRSTFHDRVVECKINMAVAFLSPVPPPHPPPPHLNVTVSYVLVSSALINIQCVWYVAWLF